MATWNINFTRIDNRAIVTLNGTAVYDSGVIDNDPALNINAPFEVAPGRVNQLIVSLYNTSGPPPADNPWHIAYTLTDPAGNVISSVDAGITGAGNPVISDNNIVYTTQIMFMS